MLLDEETGFLFKSGDMEELSDRLNHMDSLSDSRIAEMGQQARRYVETTFTPERYLQDMLHLYKSLGVKITDPDKIS